MDTPLVDLYLEKIKEQNVDHSVTLTNFYNSLYSTAIKNFPFKKLIKLYGVKRVFHAILSSYDVENFKPESPYGMLSYFCKKDIENDTVVLDYIDMSKVQKKKYKVKFTDPFEE